MRLIDADAFERELMLTGDDEICEDCCYNFVNLLASQPTVGGWISVKDRLPEKDGRYIVYADKGVESAFYEIYEGESRWTDDGERYWDIPVTHWMPLPEPPKEEEND